MNADGRTAANNPRQAHPSITIASARLAFGDHLLFDGLNFALPGGRWTCLLGPSGVGKTTLLRMIAGLVPADPGTTLTASDNAPLERRIAYMAQQDLLMPWLSLIDNVTIGFRLRGERDAAVSERARALLRRVGLAGREHDLPATCSGGMRQRAALARTLLEDRPIVLMDEPFSSLDAITRIRLQELAAELLDDRTVLLVTHDPLEALRLGHSVIVMAGLPARLQDPLRPAGDPPRDPRDPSILAEQGKLLRSLAVAAGTL